MSDLEYNLSKMREIERICKEHFQMQLPVSRLIIPDVPADGHTYTTVFESGQTLYALCEAEKPITLREVRTIIKQMGMEAEAYYPPDMDGSYFMRFARHAFLSVFPGRDVVDSSDLVYYQTLAPYSPALIRIRKVNGAIRRYNPKAQNWQKTLDFSYFHPQVQVQ